MTGKEWKIQLEGERLQHKSEEMIADFLRRHQQDSLIFDNVRNTQCWLSEIFPDIMDESEQDELTISAFVAGMLWILVNAQGDIGLRWIYTVPSPEDEEEGDETDNECD